MIFVQYYECYCTLLRGPFFRDTVYNRKESKVVTMDVASDELQIRNRYLYYNFIVRFLRFYGFCTLCFVSSTVSQQSVQFFEFPLLVK